jgi:hypothetical protein
MSVTHGFTGTVRARIEGKFTKAAPDGTSVEVFVDKAFERYLKPGTDIDEAQKLYTAKHTIAASGTLDLDFAAGMNDPFGVAQTFTRIKEILIIADGTNTNNVNVGGTVTNQISLFADASDIVPVRPGGCAQLDLGDTGVSVTAGTADLLRIANSGSGSAVTFEIVVLGS